MPKTILIIDDDKRITRMFKRRLSRMGWEVVVHNDSTAGLEEAFSLRPDLILLDIHMPGMDGYSVVRALRQLGYEGLVVACSASVTALDTQKTIEAGCDAFISKPIGLDFEQQIGNLIA